MEELDYNTTDRVSTEYGEGAVHVRGKHAGSAQPSLYAVFDEREQVSDTAGPLNEEYIISFREGYKAACSFHNVDRGTPDEDQLLDRAKSVGMQI